MYSFVKREVIGVNSSSFTISDLDGNRDLEYYFRFWLINALGAAGARFMFRPNGVTVDCKSQQYSLLNNTNTIFANTTQIQLFAFSGRDVLVGEANFYASNSPANVAMQRSLYHRSAETRLPVNDITDMRGLIGGGAWGDDSTNLTSIELATTDGGTPGLPLTAIGAGSVIETWKLLI